MAKLCLKKKSKRIGCSQRYKIEKKVKDHSRKLKREAKKKGKTQRVVKMISVPNKCPFKAEVLAEAEKCRSNLKEFKNQKKQNLKNIVKAQKLKSNVTEKKTVDSVVENKNGALNYLVQASDFQNRGPNKGLKAFAGEVRKTIETADVVIEVLDARDPLGSRSRKIEELVLSQGKRLVLLLNKIDLVPKENVLKWLIYLRSQLPTIAFKASTQDQNQKLGRYSSSNLNSSSAMCIGADLVMKLLGNYCRNRDIKMSIRVGIVGFPNVGKSSVINSLKRKKSCQAGSVPGLTRQMQEIELDKHIRLIDSPGVVLASNESEYDSIELALKNALRVESLEDPVPAVNAILRRCSVKVLMLHYTISEFDNCDQFLALLARRFGRIKKGGRPDINATAKQVLNDWNTGKLRYFTEPPEKHVNAQSELLSSEMLTKFSKEFDLDALDDVIKTVIDAVPQLEMIVDTIYDANKLLNDEEIDVEMEHDGEINNKGKTVITGRISKKSIKHVSEKLPALPVSLKIDGNTQLNKSIKSALKKHKKQQKKNTNRTNKLANTLDNMDYDFEVLDE